MAACASLELQNLVKVDDSMSHASQLELLVEKAKFLAWFHAPSLKAQPSPSLTMLRYLAEAELASM